MTRFCVTVSGDIPVGVGASACGTRVPLVGWVDAFYARTAHVLFATLCAGGMRALFRNHSVSDRSGSRTGARAPGAGAALSAGGRMRTRHMGQRHCGGQHYMADWRARNARRGARPVGMQERSRRQQGRGA